MALLQCELSRAEFRARVETPRVDIVVE